MPRFLFSYGTPNDQLIKEPKNSLDDMLVGFKLNKENNKPQAIFTNNKNDIIQGSVFEISDEDLKRCEQLRIEDYQRVFVSLKSKKVAVVFISSVQTSFTEKQKMLAGILYNGSDPEVEKDHLKAKSLFSSYNSIDVVNLKKRADFLQNFIDVRGKNIHIESPFYCDFGYNISVGENFFSNFNCCILDVNKVTIGDNVMFGPNVQVYTATHPIQALERIKGPELGYPIWIGDNVWVGGGAIICPNVQIGNNTTIGAGSVVTKDIPANVFAAGNPCRVIREL